MIKAFINLILLIILIFAGSLIIFSRNNFLGLKTYTVLTGSMDPILKVGSLVVVSPKMSYQTGDIVTFINQNGQTVTHRIAEVTSENNDFKYTTKGDANNTKDQNTLSKNSIIGKVILDLPFIGLLNNFIKSIYGLIIFIIIPALLIVFFELRNIFLEIKKKSNKELKNEPKIENKQILSAILLFFSILFCYSATFAFFTSSQVIQKNKIIMAYINPTVTPTPSGGTNVDISGNGENSENNVDITNDQTSTTTQENTNINITDIYSTTQTGSNEANNNNGDTNVNSGDASNSADVN